MIRVFPIRTKWTPTDELAFVGDPPLFRPMDRKTPVRISVTFTWDITEGMRLSDFWREFYDDVQVGGPALDDPGNRFVPGRFLKQGVTITSRGCPLNCPWCYVPKREGRIRELQIKPGHIIQDNNLLACSTNHIEAVFDMLTEQNRQVYFKGGLDSRLLNDWHRSLFDKIKIGELWLSCDVDAGIKHLKRAAQILNGISVNKRRCYVMVGFNDETIGRATRRLETVYELGFLPFCQLYENGSSRRWPYEWRSLARKWSRPAAYRSKFTEEPEGGNDD